MTIDEAAERTAAFLESRQQATRLDPEVIASHNLHELRASDLRLLLDVVRSEPDLDDA